MIKLLAPALLVAVSACGNADKTGDTTANLVEFVEDNKTGADTDHWIEMKNLAGEWEKTALVFGYIGDFEECQKAIAGLKKVNYAREYRCIPANQIK